MQNKIKKNSLKPSILEGIMILKESGKLFEGNKHHWKKPLMIRIKLFY